MEDFDFSKWLTGTAHCPKCNYQWFVIGPYGEFFTSTCPHCGFLIGEIYNPSMIYSETK